MVCFESEREAGSGKRSKKNFQANFGDNAGSGVRGMKTLAKKNFFLQRKGLQAAGPRRTPLEDVMRCLGLTIVKTMKTKVTRE